MKCGMNIYLPSQLRCECRRVVLQLQCYNYTVIVCCDKPCDNMVGHLVEGLLDIQHRASKHCIWECQFCNVAQRGKGMCGYPAHASSSLLSIAPQILPRNTVLFPKRSCRVNLRTFGASEGCHDRLLITSSLHWHRLAMKLFHLTAARPARN